MAFGCGELKAQLIFDTVWEINKATEDEVVLHAKYLKQMGFDGVVVSVAPLEVHTGYSPNGRPVRSVSGCQKEYFTGNAGYTFIDHDDGGCNTGKISNVKVGYLERLRQKLEIYRGLDLETVILPLWSRDWVSEMVGSNGQHRYRMNSEIDKYCATFADVLIDPLDPPFAILFGGDFQEDGSLVTEYDTISLWETCLDHIPSDIPTGYHTAKWASVESDLRRVFGDSRPDWLQILALQTGHSNLSPSFKFEAAKNWMTGGQIWSGEAQYRDIDINGSGKVPASEVKTSLDDLICANNTRSIDVPVYFYGHNARWQWVNDKNPIGDYPIGYSTKALSTFEGDNAYDEFKMVNRWHDQRCCAASNDQSSRDCRLDDRSMDLPDYPLDIDEPDVVFLPPIYDRLPDVNSGLGDDLTFNEGRTINQVFSKKDDVPESLSIESFTTYPEPFQSNLNVVFKLAESGSVRLNVYNLLGAKVAELENRYLRVGNYSYLVPTSNLPNGSYLVQLSIDGQSTTRRISHFR